MLKLRILLSAVGALGILGVAGQARAVTLTSLINGGSSVTSGGVVYSNFTEGGNLSSDLINVTFSGSGLQFTANWNTVTPGHNNATIGYTASVSPATGGTLISSGLNFAGHAVVHNATATVNESLTDVSTQNPYSMKVYYDGPGGLSDNLSDKVTFNPAVTSVRIIKSIDVAAGEGAFASLNFVENTFIGKPGTGVPPPVVPEPMSLALLPLALVGLGLRKKFSR